MSSLDDLTGLLQSNSTTDNVGLSLHQGVVNVWDSVGHLNEIRINGAEIPQVPYTGPDDPGMVAGAVVAVLQFGSVYLIIGRIREI